MEPSFREAYSRLSAAGTQVLEAMNAIKGKDDESHARRIELLDCYKVIDAERIAIVNASMARRNIRYVTLTQEFREAAARLERAVEITDTIERAESILNRIQGTIGSARELLEQQA